MNVLRGLPLKRIKKLPVGMLSGTNLAGGPTFVDRMRPWTAADRQWRATWKSVAVACNRYGQALVWSLPFAANSSTATAGVTLTVRASGWDYEGQTPNVLTYSGTFPIEQPWLCPPGLMQQIELTFERTDMGQTMPAWERPVLVVFQSEKFTGVPIDWQAEVNNDAAHRETGHFNPLLQPNPANVVASRGGGDPWQAQAGVYLDGRDALVDFHFIDFDYESTEVDTLPVLDKTDLLTHPPMLYPYRQVSFSESPSGEFINAGGSIRAE